MPSIKKSGCCILMVEIENEENLREFLMERIHILIKPGWFWISV
jgi:hypothetical protein